MNSNFPALAERRRIYAVGDIHGRLDLLDSVLDRIDDDLIASPIDFATIVFVGDYIDRGNDSAGVIYRLEECAARYDCVFLKGNHEQIALRFLDDARTLPLWLAVGGQATLQSYNIPVVARPSPSQCEVVQGLLRHVMPDDHLSFLRSCQLSYVADDYMFVHAGIHPDRALTDQREDDLLWIRQVFTRSILRFDKFIIHGHTPVYEPDVQPNRINIDTGAHATGKLTCLALQGHSAYFL